MNFSEIWKYSGIHLISFLIATSMNLFDQLVIVICDLDLKGQASSKKEFDVWNINFVAIY